MKVQGVVMVALSLAACGGKGSGGGTGETGGESAAGARSNGTGGHADEGGSDNSGSAVDTSEPAPPAQGAVTFSVKAPSPLPTGKSCPSGTALTTDLPPGNGPSATSYLAHVIDGEESAVVSCRVAGDTTFEISGKIQLGARGLLIEDGAISADQHGTANVTIIDSEHFSAPLQGASCVLNVEKGPASNLQVKAGAIWGSFSCPSVQSPPNDYCQASGFFVLENCAQ